MPVRDPDRSRRGLTLRSPGLALVGIAVVSCIVYLVSDAPKSQPALILGASLIIAVAFDAVAPFRAIRVVTIEASGPMHCVAGQPVTFDVRVPNLPRPIRLARPGQFGGCLIDTTEPGALTLVAPPRGIVRYLMFDISCRSPLGCWDALRRIRVWLPTPVCSGPPALGHRLRWPPLRARRVGTTDVAVIGDDLFRGVREYTRGDARRVVHWPATAHSGQLMVKEHDGTGVVALRLIAHLPAPGPASEVTAGRVAWLAAEALRRGWLVSLVTIEPLHPAPHPPALVAARGPVPVRFTDWGPGVTVAAPVRTQHDLVRRLAAAGFGVPEFDRVEGLSRWISPGGDEWL